MAYSVLARRLLVSCPGDIPTTDLHVVQKTINRWNGIYGEKFGTAIIPISWGTHAAAEFGNAPQELLNSQIVDQCDICLALFANRLGTPTALAESGTAEEIMRLSEAGRYVGVLRSRREVSNIGIDTDQLKSLEQYLKSIRSKALILDYADDADLIRNVDNILVAAVSRDQGRMDLQVAGQLSAHWPEVWPRIDSRENPIKFSGGRTIPNRDWFLVLENTGDAPARDVRVEWSDADGDDISWKTLGFELDAEPHVEALAPHSEVRFGLLVVMETPRQMNCTVSWSDDRGRQENMATVRLI